MHNNLPVSVFNMRFFTIGILLVAALAFLLISILIFRPIAETERYENGIVAWEQWERRDLSLQMRHFKTVRYYPSGKIAFEKWIESGDETYWSPAGVPITKEVFFQVNSDTNFNGQN